MAETKWGPWDLASIKELREPEEVKLYEAILAGKVELVRIAPGERIEYRPLVIKGEIWIPKWK